MSFIKPLNHFLHYRVVIFTGYGGARNEVELEGGHIYKTTPIVIPPSQRIALRPSADSDLGPVGLLLSRHEYDEMYKKFYPPIQLEDTLYHEWVELVMPSPAVSKATARPPSSAMIEPELPSSEKGPRPGLLS